MLTLNQKMGEITFSKKGKEKKLDIWDGNVLAAFTYDFIDQNGSHSRGLYAFFTDIKQVKTLIKDYGKNMFEADRGEIKVILNLYYPSAKKLLTIFTKYFGLKVECYYEKKVEQNLGEIREGCALPLLNVETKK